jgi:hypothetical protein
LEQGIEDVAGASSWPVVAGEMDGARPPKEGTGRGRRREASAWPTVRATARCLRWEQRWSEGEDVVGETEMGVGGWGR